MENINGKTAIVGMGIYEFSKDSGRTRRDMACRAIRAALDDAGLTPADIDGTVNVMEDDDHEIVVARSMGIGNLSFWGSCRQWGSASSAAMVTRAAIGVAGGAANNIVCFRTIKDASKHRQPTHFREVTSSIATQQDFYIPFGHYSNTLPFHNAGRIGMIIRRYMHEYKIDNDQFGWVPVVCREHAANNPNAIHYNKSITIEDYKKSKWVVDPLRELDCYDEIDGAVAFIISTGERAKDLKQKPVYIKAGAQSMAQGAEVMSSYYRPSISGLAEIGNVGNRLFDMAGVSPKDIDTVQLEDSCGPTVPLQLEELGFCGRGEGVSFCEGGHRIKTGGELPLNTSGGSLGEGHINGMNHIAEAVQQIRGTSALQVKDAKLALVTTGAGGPASGLILGGEK